MKINKKKEQLKIKGELEKNIELTVNGNTRDFNSYNLKLQEQLKEFYERFNISEETISTLVQNPQFALGIKNLKEQTNESIKSLFHNYEQATQQNMITSYNTGLAARIWEQEVTQSIIYESSKQALPFVEDLLFNKKINKYTIGDRIKGLSSSTQKAASDWLESSLLNGNSFKETTMGVRDIIGYTVEGTRQKGALARATRITKTEMRKAYTTAQHLANEDLVNLGVESKEFWSATLDRRTRGYHLAADYQEKGSVIPNAFLVGGQTMKYPLDPAGSAANVINCRCYVEYTTEAPKDITRAVRESEGNKKLKIRRPLPVNLKDASWKKWKKQRLGEMGIHSSF